MGQFVAYRESSWVRYPCADSQVGVSGAVDRTEDFEVGLDAWLGSGHHDTAVDLLGDFERDTGDLDPCPTRVALTRSPAMDLTG